MADGRFRLMYLIRVGMGGNDGMPRRWRGTLFQLSSNFVRLCPTYVGNRAELVVVVGLEQDRTKADIGGIRLQMERFREIRVGQEVRGLECSLELQEAGFAGFGP